MLAVVKLKYWLAGIVIKRKKLTTSCKKLLLKCFRLQVLNSIQNMFLAALRLIEGI